MHRGEDRLSGAEQPDRLLVEMSAGGAARPLGDRPGLHALGEIRTRAKRAPLRGEHDRPATGVGIELLEGLADLFVHRDNKEILRRPAYLDGGDQAIPAYSHRA